MDGKLSKGGRIYVYIKRNIIEEKKVGEDKEKWEEKVMEN